MKYGFVKVAAAVPAVRVADVLYNVQEIEKLITLADGEHVEIVCFTELCLTGYTRKVYSCCLTSPVNLTLSV